MATVAHSWVRCHPKVRCQDPGLKEVATARIQRTSTRCFVPACEGLPAPTTTRPFSGWCGKREKSLGRGKSRSADYSGIRPACATLPMRVPGTRATTSKARTRSSAQDPG
ncbi:hypothetical protein QE152_g8064 [Popillia japonica]|uniref:Uncharacterized protein n=1 Tax=Popillia japonica TaxID=7064 RepID=A0AAW1MCX0_POPJA